MGHDLKLLLLRFAQDKSFSSESGGGGPQSNMNLVPYLIHMGLYVLNTTRAVPREEKNLMTFVEATKDRWLESCFIADGPIFYSALAMLVFNPTRWRTHRVASTKVMRFFSSRGTARVVFKTYNDI